MKQHEFSSGWGMPVGFLAVFEGAEECLGCLEQDFYDHVISYQLQLSS